MEKKRNCLSKHLYSNNVTVSCKNVNIFKGSKTNETNVSFSVWSWLQCTKLILVPQGLTVRHCTRCFYDYMLCSASLSYVKQSGNLAVMKKFGELLLPDNRGEENENMEMEVEGVHIRFDCMPLLCMHEWKCVREEPPHNKESRTSLWVMTEYVITFDK